jgi:hypothetical protein
MDRLQDIAELLVSCWILGTEGDRIPTSHGLLDRALKALLEREVFPAWVREDLHFVDSRIGLQCVELPHLLDWAQRAQLTVAPNPTYRFTQVQVGPWMARRMLRQLNVSEEDAKRWGKSLENAIREAKEELEKYPSASIEAY